MRRSFPELNFLFLTKPCSKQFCGTSFLRHERLLACICLRPVFRLPSISSVSQQVYRGVLKVLHFVGTVVHLIYRAFANHVIFLQIRPHHSF